MSDLNQEIKDIPTNKEGKTDKKGKSQNKNKKKDLQPKSQEVDETPDASPVVEEEIEQGSQEVDETPDASPVVEEEIEQGSQEVDETPDASPVIEEQSNQELGTLILDSLNSTLEKIVNPRLEELAEQVQSLQAKLETSDKTFASLGGESNPEYVRAVLEGYQQFSLAITQVASDTQETLKIVNINKNIVETIGERTKVDDPNQVIIQLLRDIKEKLTPPPHDILDLRDDAKKHVPTPQIPKKLSFHSLFISTVADKDKKIIQQGIGLVFLVSFLIYIWFLQ